MGKFNFNGPHAGGAVPYSVYRGGYRLDGPGFESRYGQDIFFSLVQKRPDRLWRPPSFLCSVYRRSFLAVKREVNQAPPQVPSFSRQGKMIGPLSVLPDDSVV